jgi:hypothetical protein
MELGMSAAELAATERSRKPHHRNSQWTARRHWRYGAAPGKFLRHDGGILAESADPV